MLGLAPVPAEVSAGLAAHRAGRRAHRLPVLPLRPPGRRAAPPDLQRARDRRASGEDPEASALLAGIYTLATRMLIKLDDQQLGWMAADRARVIAAGSGNPLIAAEASRNLAVLARKAGWHSQAMSIALTAAAHPGLRGDDERLAAERGLLLQSAAYTAAWNGDTDGMREMTAEAAAIAARLTGPVLLRDHGGGFTPATVQLHRISAEYSTGEPGAAVSAAAQIPPASLPTTERRARYWTDLARAWGQWGQPRRLPSCPADRRTRGPRGNPRPPRHPRPGLQAAPVRPHQPRTARTRPAMRHQMTQAPP